MREEPMTGFVRTRRCGVRAAALLALAGMTSSVAGQVGAPIVSPGFQRVAPGATTPDGDGFLRRWLLLEPIDKPNRSNTGFSATYVRQALTTPYFPGQFTAMPRDGQVVKAAQPLRWHALESTAFNVKLFDFARGLGKPTYGVIFWAVTVVDAPREMRDVRMAVGSNSASIWWLNGKETVGLFNDRRMVMDDVLSDRVTLRKGRNVIRGAVINGPGLSDFCVRFLDANGRPITEVKTDVR
jgi:hypothetical protein